MSTAALVGASYFNEAHFMEQRFDYVIAVDGGYASLRSAGVVPDAVVGDFDSLGYVPDCRGVCCFPPEKDESDMELALDLACREGFGTLFVYGALAGRIDHTVANLQLLLRFARKGARVIGVGDSFALTVLDGAGASKIAFSAFDPAPLDALPQGRFISAFAWGGTARKVTETGLKYSLDAADVPDDCSLGLSNEFTGSAAEIRLEGGNLLVVLPLDALSYVEGL